MRLYRVKIRGAVNHKVSYAVASDSGEAYRKVRDFLDDEDWGGVAGRDLLSVELIAEEHYTLLDTLLFL